MGQTLIPGMIMRVPDASISAPKCEYCGRLPSANATCDGCGAPVKIAEPNYTEMVKELNRVHTATVQQIRTRSGYTGFPMSPNSGVSSFLSGFADGFLRARRLR